MYSKRVKELYQADALIDSSSLSFLVVPSDSQERFEHEEDSGIPPKCLLLHSNFIMSASLSTDLYVERALPLLVSTQKNEAKSD